MTPGRLPHRRKITPLSPGDSPQCLRPIPLSRDGIQIAPGSSLIWRAWRTRAIGSHQARAQIAARKAVSTWSPARRGQFSPLETALAWALSRERVTEWAQDDPEDQAIGQGIEKSARPSSG